MYSLYRAWFGGEDSYPRLNRLSPPDVVVRVGNQGEHQFVAHKEILATHSGYMKALLATTTDAGSSSSTTDSAITSVSVSSVDGEAFAPLLNYMYTGHLEVTLDNIYNVLLATHLLHMPGALEECRSALLRLRTPPTLALSSPATQTGSILRPVPNRLVAPAFCWPQTSLYTPGSLGLSHLSLPTIPILPQPIIHDATPNSSVPYSIRGMPASPRTLQSQMQHRSRSRSPHQEAPRTSQKDDSEYLESHQKRSLFSPTLKRQSLSPSGSSEKISVTDMERPSRRGSRGRSRSSNEPKIDEVASEVVFDVACCDGPVQFHRVLNENYAAPSATVTALLPPTRAPRSCLEDGNSSENDENGRPVSDAAMSESETRPLNGSYTCKYCRHTFKSQYCYRKHAKRHLLPTEIEANQQRAEGRKRMEQFQDLNVQYYPCKICGSKFPSYYFVHKHRKLCHSGVDEPTAEEPSVLQNTNESVDS